MSYRRGFTVAASVTVLGEDRDDEEVQATIEALITDALEKLPSSEIVVEPIVRRI